MANREFNWDEASGEERSGGVDYRVPLSGEQTAEWLEGWNIAVARAHRHWREAAPSNYIVELHRTELLVERVRGEDFDMVRNDLNTAVDEATNAAP